MKAEYLLPRCLLRAAPVAKHVWHFDAVVVMVYATNL
jgi:hypothetical protein